MNHLSSCTISNCHVIVSAEEQWRQRLLWQSSEAKQRCSSSPEAFNYHVTKKKSRNTPHWLETLTSCDTMAAPLKQERLSNNGLQLSPESFGQTPAAHCAENIRRFRNIKQSFWLFFMLGWNNNKSRSVGLMHVFASNDPQFYGERRLELYCLNFVHGKRQKITQCNNPECLSLPPTFYLFYF